MKKLFGGLLVSFSISALAQDCTVKMPTKLNGEEIKILSSKYKIVSDNSHQYVLDGIQKCQNWDGNYAIGRSCSTMMYIKARSGEVITQSEGYASSSLPIDVSHRSIKKALKSLPSCKP